MIFCEKVEKSCFGCEACTNVCSKNAIRMINNQEGFRYPTINKEKCIECGLCEKICPAINPIKTKESEKNFPAVYAAWNRQPDIRLKSSSGGIFSAIAKSILDKNGIVVGAAFNEKLEVIHKIIEEEADLQSLRGSKYLQSKINDLYREIALRLKNKQLVFFTGTPCQVAGLYAYLGEDNPNLFTADIVCHGVPSEKVFYKVLEQLEKKYKSSINQVFFRDKKNGWKNYSFSVLFKNGKKYSKDLTEAPFFRGYLKDIFLRASCYQCSYARIPRVGNITLGDFWKVHLIESSLDNDQGTSLLLINDQKGNQLFNDCQKSIVNTPCTLENAISGNHCLIKPVAEPPNRAEFFNDLEHQSFEFILKKYLKQSSLTGYLRKIKRKFKFFIKKALPK